jgi:hypothetical protein
MSRSASEPLRAVTEEESKELHRVSRASSETRIRHQRAVALLAVAEGKSLSEAARLAGWKSHDPVTKVTRRFNSIGMCALDDLPRPGPHRMFGREDQVLPPSMCCRDAFVPCAITDRSAMPSQMASDPLGNVSLKQCSLSPTAFFQIGNGNTLLCRCMLVPCTVDSLP